MIWKKSFQYRQPSMHDSTFRPYTKQTITQREKHWRSSNPIIHKRYTIVFVWGVKLFNMTVFVFIFLNSHAPRFFFQHRRKKENRKVQRVPSLCYFFSLQTDLLGHFIGKTKNNPLFDSNTRSLFALFSTPTQ